MRWLWDFVCEGVDEQESETRVYETLKICGLL